MRVHCGGVRVVPIGTCRTDLCRGLWCKEGYLDPDHASRMDHRSSPFKDRVSIHSQVLEPSSESNGCALRQGRRCDDLETYGPGTVRPIPGMMRFSSSRQASAYCVLTQARWWFEWSRSPGTGGQNRRGRKAKSPKSRTVIEWVCPLRSSSES
jgi:hypothetical protein